jgi:hypothetical protein
VYVVIDATLPSRLAIVKKRGTAVVAHLIANPLPFGYRRAVPTRPRNRQLIVQIAPWKPGKHEAASLSDDLWANWRAKHGVKRPERREVTVHDTFQPAVRFYVSFDPDGRELLVQSVRFWPGPAPSATDFRVPFASYLRIVRHAVAQADEGHLRYEIRDGKIYDLADDAPIVLGPLPPRRSHYREPRKRVELDQVAAIYRDNPRSPTRAVQLALRVSRRTAARRVAEARNAGLIPPAGEQSQRHGRSA